MHIGVGCGDGECDVHECTHSWFIVFVTDTNVRLVGGSVPHEGRVEVYHNGTWGTVCNDDWDLRDATVVCHQLGYVNASAALGSSGFGSGSGSILLSKLDSVGNESNMAECDHLGTIVHNCTHSEDAGVVCEGQSTIHLYNIRVCICACLCDVQVVAIYFH